jgi:FkbH-like protein
MANQLLNAAENRKTKIKCVVWDLDNTLWDGILLEDQNVFLKKGVKKAIEALDERGILQSIASKNNYDTAMSKLNEMGLDQYFIYPQIGWGAKSQSVKRIAELINIGVDTLAFLDDQAFERDEVSFAIPEILCLDAGCVETILDMPRMNPTFLTDDSKMRRIMYRNDILRNDEEASFSGTPDEFLFSLNMILTVSDVEDGDLQRAEELTVRTHQLNSTGITYSYEELDSLRKNDKYRLLIAGLEDRYGTYGKIGLALIELTEEAWILKLLLMSCRVMSRGTGTALLNYIMREAGKFCNKLRAEFVPTDKNRMMYVTYKFGGFSEIYNDNELIVFERDLSDIPPFPDYVRLAVNRRPINS